MRQRLGIAIALSGNPDFLVLDEPVNGLDPQGIVEMRELVLKLNREHGITILISSHILDELSRLATHYGFIDGGRMVKEMSAEELEARCRKCVRIEVSDTKTLARELDIMKVEAPVPNSVLVALFVGGDYSGGTLRNKIIAGHRRSHIYITNLIVCSFAGIAFGLAFVIPQSILGLLFGGQIQANIKTLLLYAGLGFALIVAFTALFVLIAMLCQNKSHTAAECILLAFILIFLGIYITSALNEPEYIAGYSYTENGVTVEKPETKNPNYIDGTKRQVYEFLQNFTPGGQIIVIDNMSVDKPVILAVYDGIILLAATGFGMVIFRRKDLK